MHDTLRYVPLFFGGVGDGTVFMEVILMRKSGMLLLLAVLMATMCTWSGCVPEANVPSGLSPELEKQIRQDFLLKNILTVYEYFDIICIYYLYILYFFGGRNNAEYQTKQRD